MKKFLTALLSVAMVVTVLVTPTQAAQKATITAIGEVTDAGQSLKVVEVDYTPTNTKITGEVTTGTYKVHATLDTTAIRPDETVTSYGDYDKDITVVDVKVVDAQHVHIYVQLNEAARLAYLSSARNFPGDFTVSVEQLLPIKATAMDGTDIGDQNYAYEATHELEDSETAKFTSVVGSQGINYQLHNGTNDSLIVWFHGNGEGDYLASGNNVSQMLANRGTVAWATDEAQAVFGDATVMAFQAPDTWYYAQTDGLLAKAEAEIQEVIASNGIDPEKVYVSGCSAGGYMTTRMIIAYPELFAAAAINCPALDVASARGGETPTDEELAGIKNSKTKIWLVQGENDSSVDTELCSKRMWSILTDSQPTFSSRHDRAIQSGFDTFETEDGKYKLSLYDTTTEDRTTAKLVFAEDYNQDGTLEAVEYSNHWSWIYTLKNDPEAKDGQHIWEWMIEELPENPTITAVGEVTDAGQSLKVVEIDYTPTLAKITGEVDENTYTVHAKLNTDAIRPDETVTSYGDYDKDITIVKVEKVDDQHVNVYVQLNEAARLAYLSSARNFPGAFEVTVSQKAPITTDLGDKTFTYDNATELEDAQTAKFTSVVGSQGINYQLHNGTNDALIVWFHGNGEGDYLASGNNVSQMLANRGTVAWATDEAQAVFGDATVMAFQAPDTWYYAQTDGLLAKAEAEIQEVIAANGIDPEKVYVSGCSAGGYMTTRMIIAYPDLFTAAAINCPALDVASDRGGETPTDAELAGIKNSDTRIWLVQGENDASVDTELCSKRMWAALTEGEELVESRHDREIASGFDTYETTDAKYKLSLYDTTTEDRTTAKLVFAEDYNQDGTLEAVEYSNHWSWIYTLRNDPEAKSGEHIWSWMVNPEDVVETKVVAGKAELTAEVTDAGQNIYEVEITIPGTINPETVTLDTFTVHAKGDTTAYRPEDVASYGDYDCDRTIVGVEVKGNKVVLTLLEGETGSATLAYLASARNFPVDLTYTVTQNKTYKLTDGTVISKASTYACDNTVADQETAKFESVIVEDGINYQLHKGTNDTLIVWFHGNGEGDYLASDNNVSQMLANRGTVAWATDEAQAVFGDATVMAFQAPDTWYYAQTDDLLAKAEKEIQEVIKANGIDPEKVFVSGCSAGGYMTTRMIIAYPDLFAAAAINCPALDVASDRGGETPTDAELEGIKNSKTRIWLVQGENDASVDTELCSKRMWAALTEGEELVESRHDRDIASGFDTYETKDGKYKLSLYDTTTEDRTTAKLVFAEDYNKDGTLERVEYSNHWSWIYTLRNDPQAKDGQHIWQWMATTEEQPSTPEVNTGDNAPILIMGTLMLLSAAAFVELKKRQAK